MRLGTFSDPSRNRGRQPGTSLQSSATTSSRRSASPLNRSQAILATHRASPPASQNHNMPNYRSFTNQNRMEAAVRHWSQSPQLPAQTCQMQYGGGISANPFGTLPTISVPQNTNRSRSHRRSNTQPSSTAPQSCRSNPILSVKYIFCINPVPVRNITKIFYISTNPLTSTMVMLLLIMRGSNQKVYASLRIVSPPRSLDVL